MENTIYGLFKEIVLRQPEAAADLLRRCAAWAPCRSPSG